MSTLEAKSRTYLESQGWREQSAEQVKLVADFARELIEEAAGIADSLWTGGVDGGSQTRTRTMIAAAIRKLKE